MNEMDCKSRQRATHIEWSAKTSTARNRYLEEEVKSEGCRGGVGEGQEQEE